MKARYVVAQDELATLEEQLTYAQLCVWEGTPSPLPMVNQAEDKKN